MRKLGKKVSFLTKIMLVIGLLISNLSSLSVVFAYEATGNVEITYTDGSLNVKYLGELAEDVENVLVNVYENYTYLDGTLYYVDNTALESGKVSNYTLTSLELVSLEGLDFASIASDILFDGLYEVKVEVTDLNGEVIDTGIYSENLTHDSGFKVKVLDSSGVEVTKLEDGTYSVLQSNSNVKVVGQMLPGGLSPMDMFIYDDTEYMASELVELEFGKDMDFAGRLYGEYNVPVEVKLLDSNLEEIVLTNSVDILYESYAKNAEVLNEAMDSLEYGNAYEFYGTESTGILSVLLSADRVNTMLDLYELMNSVLEGNEIITYVLGNSTYEDVLASYDYEVAGVTLEEYLGAIVLDDTASLSLLNEGLIITYNVVVLGDLNSDNSLTEDDLLELINQVVGSGEVDLNESNLYDNDDEVNTLDVMYLDQVLKTGTWEVELTESEATLDARLEVVDEDIVSGDEFTVNYVLTLSDYAVNGFSGLFNYDKEMLELVSVEVMESLVGNYYEDKFLYLTNDSLALTSTLDENNNEIFEPTEYVVLTATFKALKAGSSVISVEDYEYFNQANYLVLNEMEILTEVVVNASDDNSLSSLTVAGQQIELVEDVLNYEITVSNDVTSISVEALVNNIAANVSSIVYPEELIEGANTVIVTVVSENGDEKVYTVTVYREEAPKEETTTTQMNYNNNYEQDEEDEGGITVEVDKLGDKDDKKDKDEESNLSRIIIIILILLVIAGLIYLIFKDEDDEETKKTNKEINKLKKDDKEIDTMKNNKGNNKSNNSSKNKKK